MGKVTIFGSTGMTGLCALQSALEKEVPVRVLVRDESKLPDDLRSKVEIVKGDVLNPQEVNNALKGSDKVVVVLGTRNDLSKTTVMSDGLKNIIAGMKELGITVISVCLSAFLFYPVEKVPPQFHNIDQEHRLMLKLLKESDLDWIAVLPPHISDNPKSEIIISHDTHPGPRAISKFNLGEFLFTAVDSAEHYQRIVGIANKQ